jgi:hypothetical protein
MHSHQLVYCAFLIGIFGVVAKAVPPRWRDLWQRFVRGLSALARHKTLSWIGLGVFVLVVRAALLPVWPIPRPSIYDELVTFFKLTLSRMAVWPIRRTRFGGFLKALISFNSPLMPPGSHPRRDL